MSNQHNQSSSPKNSVIYQITLEGHLNNQWSRWFEGMDITQLESGETLLTGAVTDQSALFGLLKKIRDLGLILVGVVRVKPTDNAKFTISGAGKKEDV